MSKPSTVSLAQTVVLAAFAQGPTKGNWATEMATRIKAELGKVPQKYRLAVLAAIRREVANIVAVAKLFGGALPPNVAKRLDSIVDSLQREGILAKGLPAKPNVSKAAQHFAALPAPAQKMLAAYGV